MNSHWPILVAIALLGAAVGLGLWTQQEYAAKGVVESEVRRLPRTYVATAPVTTSETAVVNPGITAAVEHIPANQPVLTPLPGNAGQPVGVPGANPGQAMLNRTRTGGGQALPTLIPGDPNAILTNLKNAVIQRFGTPPIETNTGFSVPAVGARMDVILNPTWSIAIYNDNRAAPTVQSPTLLGMYTLAAEALEFDANAPMTPTADGKSVRRALSKLGKISITTYPELNNSVKIVPVLGKPQATGNPGARPGTVALPGQPAPVAPVIDKPALPGVPLPVQPKPNAVPGKPTTADQF